jgi:hypothetical protein
LTGGVLGHVLSVRLQRLNWQREDQRRSTEREHAERIDFTVEVRFVCLQHDAWLVELAAMLDNKGLVWHTTNELRFELRCIYPDDELSAGGPEIGGQTRIPNILTAGSWLPANWGATVIEPGLTTRYSYVSHVPKRATAVLLHGIFTYTGPGEKDLHTAESLQAVPHESA